MDLITDGCLKLDAFPAEVWRPLLSYLGLESVLKLTLCGSTRTNRRISESMLSANLKYGGGVRIHWPPLLSSFPRLESILLEPIIENFVFNLDYSTLSTLPSTLKALQVRIQQRERIPYALPSEVNSGFPHTVLDIAQLCPNLETLELAVLAPAEPDTLIESISRLTALSSLTLPSITSEQVEALPDSLTYLKIGYSSLWYDLEHVKFPKSLKHFEIRQFTSMKVISCLPPSLHTLRTSVDIVELLQNLSDLPISLTHLHSEPTVESVPLELATLPALKFPPHLRYFAVYFFLQDYIVKQFPNTLETLTFQPVRGDGIQWSSLPPSLTECPLLSSTLPSHRSLPRNLTRFTNTKYDAVDHPLLDVLASNPYLPQSLQEMSLIVQDPEDVERPEDVPNFYHGITLPPALTRLTVNPLSKLSDGGMSLIEILHEKLPQLSELTCLRGFNVASLNSLKQPLKSLKLSGCEGTPDLLQFREKGTEEGLSLPALMPLLPWCASLLELNYVGIKGIFDTEWISTLPPTLETLTLIEDGACTLPGTILLSLPPFLRHLSVVVSEILPGQLLKLPRTLTEMSVTCSINNASYPPDELLSLPTRLLRLTLTKSTRDIDLHDDFIHKFQMARKHCQLTWKSFRIQILL